MAVERMSWEDLLAQCRPGTIVTRRDINGHEEAITCEGTLDDVPRIDRNGVIVFPLADYTVRVNATGALQERSRRGKVSVPTSQYPFPCKEGAKRFTVQSPNGRCFGITITLP